MPLMNFWKEFLSSFSESLHSTPLETFSKAWESSRNRTELYEGALLRAVAEKMGLLFKSEEFKVDYTLCVQGVDGYQVPAVFVESENVALSAHHEIRKLCCLHAPLKVLIVCAEWSNDTNVWKHGGYKNKLIQQWSKQIREHNKVWPSPCITGVIVAEWHESLRYYAFAFDHLGEIVDAHRVIFDKKAS